MLDTVALLEQALMELLEFQGFELAEQDELRVFFKLWAEALLTLPMGSFCIENLMAEYQLPFADKLELLKVTLANADSIAGSGDETWAFRALAMACKACDKDEHPLFLCRGDEVKDETGELARFISFKSALDYLLPPGVHHSDSGKLWEKKLSRPWILRDERVLRTLLSDIRGQNGNVFSTLARWVEEGDLTGAELATRVCYGLGLLHLFGENILEVRIPEEQARKTGLFKKPTFTDAGAYPVFLASRREDKLGYARDLSSSHPGARGGPEVLHGSMPARLASGLRFLGDPGPRPPILARPVHYNGEPEGEGGVIP